VAFSTRAIGNLARPFYPDGVDGGTAGPLSKRAGEWSVLSTGLQLDLSYNALIQHVAFVRGLAADVGNSCAGIAGFDQGFTAGSADTALANGLQIFPGGVPIYRDGQLVGAIGVSGDGVDQDDMIAFLGVAESADKLRAGSSTPIPDNATASRRADTLEPQGSRLRYVSCPPAPFLGANDQEPCRDR
jgi:Haem-degrading